MCQYFTLCVNNVFGNFFAVEVMHQVFFHYLVGIFAADINLNGFSCFAVHIIGCIQVNFKHVACNKFIVNIFRNNGICFGNQFSGYRAFNAGSKVAPDNGFAQFVLACAKGLFAQAAAFFNKVKGYNIAVIFAYNNILRNVYKAAGKVTGVCRTQCGICQAFAGTVSGNKVFQYG